MYSHDDNDTDNMATIGTYKEIFWLFQREVNATVSEITYADDELDIEDYNITKKGQTDIPGYVYLKNIWKGVMKYNDSIVISAPTMNPTTLATGITSAEPSINSSKQPSTNLTGIPSINRSVPLITSSR